MPFKWTLLIIIIWITMAFVGGAVSGTSVNGQNVNVLQEIMQPQTASSSSSFLPSFVAVILDPNWWKAIGTIATFDFPGIFPYDSAWQLVRWGIFMALGGSFVFTLALAVLSGAAGG